MKTPDEKETDRRVSLLLSTIERRVARPDRQFLNELRDKSTSEFLRRSAEGTEPFEKAVSIGRAILKSRITRLAAVAGIVIVVMMIVNEFSGSIDGASAALAQMTEAIRAVPWMHAHTEVDGPDHKGQVDEWICFEKSIEIMKQVNGTVTYRDEGQDTMYVYDPVNNKLTITLLSDRYAIPRRTPLLLSPTEGIENLIEGLKAQGQAKLSVSFEETNGQSVQIVRAVSSPQDNDAVSQEMTIAIDTQSKLPIHMEAIVTVDNGEVLGTAHVNFDYPMEGPKDIYGVGVPADAEVIDRRPRPGTESSEVNYSYVADPENPTQKMLILYGGVNIDLVRIPEGQFSMGSPKDEIGYPERVLQVYSKSKQDRVRQLKHPSNEDPEHLVKVDLAFYLSKYEITCAEFRKFRPEFRKYPHSVGPLRGSKTTFAVDLDEQPAGVSLNDAVEFCKWLSEKTGLNVRLPSEAEWEYACRAGTQSRFYWGDSEEKAGKYANLADKSYEEASPGSAYSLDTDDGNAGLAPVGQYLPNNFGLYDMIGNASEWVQGIYSENAYSIDSDNTCFDESNEDNQQQYCRGGSWRADIIYSRCASRWHVPQDLVSMTSRSSIGFRILIDEP